MIDITKAEAFMIREAGLGHDVHMSSRSHGKNAKSYFLTTSPKAMKLLNQYRKDHTCSVERE